MIDGRWNEKSLQGAAGLPSDQTHLNVFHVSIVQSNTSSDIQRFCFSSTPVVASSINAMAVTATASSPTETPVKTDLPLLIVDASNVAFGLEGGVWRAKFKLLAHVMAHIPPAGFEMKVIADASLRHRVDDKKRFEECVRAGLVLQAPAGRSADQFIRQLAESRMAKGQPVLVLSNDLFRQLPDFHVRRVAFLAIGEEEVLFDPPLKEALGAKHEDPTRAPNIPSEGLFPSCADIPV